MKERAEEKDRADKHLNKTQEDLAAEKAKCAGRLQEIQRDLDALRAVCEAKERNVEELRTVIEDMSVQHARDKETFALRDKDAQKDLEHLRSELLEIEGNRARLTNELAEEKEVANERVRWVRVDLETQKAAYVERETEVARLITEMEVNCVAHTRERDEAQRELNHVRSELLEVLSDQKHLAGENADERVKADLQRLLVESIDRQMENLSSQTWRA